MNPTPLARLATAALLALTCSPILRAQEPEGEQRPGAELTPVATAALGELQSGAWSFAGRVRIDEPETTDAFGGMMMLGGRDDSEPFTGEVSLHRTEAGEMLLTSASRLPGVRLYTKGGKTLVNTTTAVGTDLSIDALTGDLRSILAPRKLCEWAGERAIWKEVTEGPEATEAAEAGGRILTAKLPETLVSPPADNGFGAEFGLFDPSTAKVMRAELTIGVTRDGGLKAFRLTIVRSDPAAAMQKLFEQSAMDGTLEIDASSLESMEQVEGATHVYELTRTDASLDEATTAVLEMFREAAK